MSGIKIEGLSKTYGKVKALDGLNMTIEEGSVFGFLGPNGAGKTTTLRILAGLARPTCGRVWIGELEIEKSKNELAKKIGYLPEEPAFYTWMTPREYLDYIGRIFGLSTRERRTRTDELLELTSLKEVAGRRISGFSRGMRQRLGLAQALVNQPAFLLLDEPISALDPAGRKDVLEMIERLAECCTILMSSHILADVERVCDTVGIINKGRMITQSKRAELLDAYAVSAMEIEVGNGASKMIPEWVKQIRSIPGVQHVKTEGMTIRIAADNIQRMQNEIIRFAAEKELFFERLEIVKPSLEDVFMRLINDQEVTL